MEDISGKNKPVLEVPMSFRSDLEELRSRKEILMAIFRCLRVLAGSKCNKYIYVLLEWNNWAASTKRKVLILNVFKKKYLFATIRAESAIILGSSDTRLVLFNFAKALNLLEHVLLNNSK